MGGTEYGLLDNGKMCLSGQKTVDKPGLRWYSKPQNYGESEVIT